LQLLQRACRQQTRSGDCLAHADNERQEPRLGWADRCDHGLDADRALDAAHASRQHRVAAQLAIEGDTREDKDREHHHRQEQHLPGHDRLRDTMVRIVTIPVVSIPTAIAKTVRPSGSMNSVWR
jgi:hypothetical protein